MLQAAAMLVGLWAVWLLLTQAFDLVHLGVALAVAVACFCVTAWFCGARELGAPAGLAVQRFRRAPEVLRAALTTARAALAADVSLRPALIRIKPRPSRDAAKTALADAISTSPGWLVVESNSEGLLAHVLDEDAVQPHQITALEDGVRAAFGKQVEA